MTFKLGIPEPFKPAIEFFNEKILPWVQGGSTALLSFYGLKEPDLGAYVVTGVAILSSVALLKRQSKIPKLEENIKTLEGQVGKVDSEKEQLHREKQQLESEKLELQNILKEQLTHEVRAVSKRLGLSDTERVSIYYHSGKHFIRLARYSLRNTYHRSGRSIYPEGQGCIQKAWDDGEATVLLPDPEKNRKTYYRELGKLGIEKETAEKFTMLSRVLYGRALEHELTRIAVVIFESTDPDKFNDVEEIRRHFQEEAGEQRIVTLIRSTHSLHPDPAKANSVGL